MESIPLEDCGNEPIQDSDDDHFRRLYDQVLECFFEKMDNIEITMNRAISFIKESFWWNYGRKFSDIDFSRKDMLCGYMFRYGPHGAGLARSRISEVIENPNCWELEILLKEPHINVASLGGGPGNDAIGFCSALSRAHYTGSLEIYVVDAVPQWKRSIRVAEQLLKQGGFGDASNLFQQGKVKLHFAPCTLPQDLHLLPMRDIDIFLICKLFSIMSWDDRRKLVKNLHSNLHPDTLVMLIDSPFHDDLWCDEFELLHLSEEDRPYQSGTHQVERFGHNDYVTSKSQIAVLMKRSLPCIFLNLDPEQQDN